MWYSLILILFLIDIISCGSASGGMEGGKCPPSDNDLKIIVKFLEAKLESIKKTKPGTNTRDADFLIHRLVHDIVTSKRFGPCNDKVIEWDEVLPEINRVRAECYKPGDYTTAPVQKEFVNCAKKFIPEGIMRFGTPQYIERGMKVCACFGNTVLPNWEKYKKVANSYVDEFKTLKHRKK